MKKLRGKSQESFGVTCFMLLFGGFVILNPEKDLKKDASFVGMTIFRFLIDCLGVFVNFTEY
jgi:hypothetical protein